MKLRGFARATVCLLALGLMVARGQQAPPGYKSIEPVDGRAFPESEAALEKLRDHPTPAAVEKMRAHAWDLFVGLTKDDPAWQTWYTKCDVKLAILKCPDVPAEGVTSFQRQLRNFEIPVQSLQSLNQLYVGGSATPAPQAGKRTQQLSPFQTVAMDFIRDFRKQPQYSSVLFNKEATNRILAGSVGAEGAASFPRESIVLKTVWEVIHRGRGPQTNVVGPVKTWDSAVWNEIHSADPDPSRFAKHKVTIDTTPGKPCEDRDYDDGEKVPLSCFYFHQLTEEDVKSFPHILAAIDVQHLVRGDYLILVGMHVATRELTEWVWATFWWENHSVSDCHAKGRPVSLGMQWRHFLMETTLSELTPREKDGGPKICFNPYLETDVRIPYGVISNCIQCHSRAGYGPPQRTLDGYAQGILGRDGRRLANGNTPDPDYFSNFHKTDFLWSLVPQQDTTMKEILNKIQLLLEEETK